MPKPHPQLLDLSSAAAVLLCTPVPQYQGVVLPDPAAVVAVALQRNSVCEQTQHKRDAVDLTIQRYAERQILQYVYDKEYLHRDIY